MPYPKRDPEAEARRVAALREALRTPEARANASKGAKRRYAREGERELASERTRKQLADPDMRATMNANRVASFRANHEGVEFASSLPEYKVWGTMVQRCTNPRAKYFENYGGRGISVCPEWMGRGGFARFIEHVGRRPTSKHSIDRIDNARGYEPGNVRWATLVEQSRNTRRNRMVEIDGVSKTLAEWASISGLSAMAIAYRIKIGKSGAALIEPSKRGARARA